MMKRKVTFMLAVFTLMACLIAPMGMNGQTRTEEVIYTLEPATGSNSNYASNCDITITGITWNLTGNSQMIPWRIGGKSLTGVNRNLYSKTAIQDNVSKIEVTHGAASSITVNSWTVIVASDANFSNVVSTLTPTFAPNTTTTITRPANADWSNCYYKFVYNVTVSGSSNKFVEFTRAKFYAETGAASYNVTINGMMNGTVQSSHQTATPNTTVTLTPQPATNYALGSIDVTGSPSGTTPSGGLTNNGNGTYSFTMPNEDVYVGATFLPATTVTIDDTNLTNLDILNGTNAGSLTATVTENVNGNAVSGATVTWASSDTNVATVNNGTITLVGVGSTNITATYAGDQSYAGSVGTYQLTVINGLQVTYDFTDVNNFLTAYPGSTHPSTGSGNNTATFYYTNGDMFTASGSSYYFSTSYFLFGKSGALINLPTFQGYKITQVIAHSSSGCSTNVSIAIVDDQGTVVANAQQWGQNGTYTYVIPAASQTSPLSLKVTNSYNSQITGITLVRESLGVITDTEITVPQGFNFDVYQSTTGGVLTAAVTYDNNGTTTNVPNATVTWASSDTNVATVNQNGVVTLVAAGTTDITATYAGDATYAPSSDTYQLVVTNSGPVVTATGNLTNFIYAENYGPSAAQTIEVSGNNLSFNISVELDNGANSAFEMSTDNTTWQSTVTLTRTNGTVAPTTVYIRMKAGKVAYQYSDVARVKYNNGTHASFNLIGDVVTPMSVADAIDAIDNAANNQVNGAFVEGIICQVDSYNSNFHSITYWISDDGGTTTMLEVYSGLGLNGAQFSAVTDLSVGDEVVVYGDLKIYNNVYEFNYNSQIVSLTSHQAQQYTLAVTSVTDAEIFVFDATDPDDNNWVYLFDGEDDAQVNDGTPIALSVSADQGYELSELLVNNVNHVADIDGGVYLFNMPAQNVTITVTAVQAYSITYSENGVETQSQVLSSTLTLPAGDDLDSEFTFAGWTTTPGNFVTPTAAGTQVNIQGGETFYAVYARTEGREAYYEKVTEDLQDWSGNYLIVAVGTYANNTDYSVAFDGSLETLDAAMNHIEVEIESDRIESDESNAESVFTIAPIIESGETTGWSIQSASGYYIGRTTSGNGMLVSDQTAYSHSIAIDQNEEANIISSGGPALRFNKNANDKRFRYYGSGQQPIQLYKEVIVSQGTVHYFTRVFIMETAEANMTITGPSIIPSGSMLDMGNYTLTNGLGAANFILEDGAQYMGNSVAATMQKVILPYSDQQGVNDNWYAIAHPFTQGINPGSDNYMQEMVTDVAGEYTYDFYRFDNRFPAEEWRNFRAADFGMTVGQGYLYAHKHGITLNFTGTLNATYVNGQNATVTSVGFGNASNYNNFYPFADYFFAGNPFSCEATIVNFSDFFVLNEAGTEFIPTEDGILAPMQGAILYDAQAPTTVNGYYITYKSGTEGDTPAIGDGDELELKKALINLSVSKNRGEKVDLARVRFGEGSMLGKFQLHPNSTKIYFTENGKDYAVVRAQAQGEMPVNFKAEKNGTYTLNVEAKNVEMNYLHIIDNMTGMDIDLLQNPNYTFEASSSDYASRFRLVFNANTGVEETMATETFAYFNGSEWLVNNQGNATLQVIDMMGRVISTEQINGNAAVNLNQSAGIYMLRLVNGENVMVQKVVVR